MLPESCEFSRQKYSSRAKMPTRDKFPRMTPVEGFGETDTPLETSWLNTVLFEQMALVSQCSFFNSDSISMGKFFPAKGGKTHKTFPN